MFISLPFEIMDSEISYTCPEELICEYKLHTLPNKKVRATKDHGENYIKVKTVLGLPLFIAEMPMKSLVLVHQTHHSHFDSYRLNVADPGKTEIYR